MCAALLLACRAPSREAPTPAPPSGDTLTLAVRADVTGFYPNPPMADEAYTYDVNWAIFEGLVRFSRRIEPEPALAERWENPDDRTYVFTLRDGLRFSDGRPVTAEDVAASLNAARERGWATRNYLQAIESVRAAGPRSVVIRTRFPYLVLLFKLPWGLVLPADAVAATPVAAVGTGPYRLESWEPGRGFALARNPHFREAPAGFARARFVVVSDAGERLGKLLRGEAQVADQVPLDMVEALRGRDDVTVFAGAGIRVIFLGLRVDAPPFSDARVREAVDLAIDREELISRAYGGRTVPASQLVPQAIVGFNPAIPVTAPDRARARRLLDEAGHRQGFAVRLDGPNNRYVNDEAILREVARQLREVGIRVDVNALDKREYFPLAFAGRSKFHLLGWECQSGEAGQALDAVAHSRSGPLLGSANTTGLSDPVLDRLIEDSNRALDLKDRTAALQKAMARLAETRAIVPLLVQAEAVAVSRAVEWEPPLGYALRVADMRPAGPRR
jgi:peptide/nickel transport system substrate-binding protein